MQLDNFFSMKRVLFNRKRSLFIHVFLMSILITSTSNCLLDLILRIEYDMNAMDAILNMENCKLRSKPMQERIKGTHALLYIKMPVLRDEYLEYDVGGYIEYDLGNNQRKEKAIPIYIEFNGTLLNPLKEDVAYYEVSSKIKEKIILENTSITKKNCTFMSLGSKYLFPVSTEKGLLSVILYFNLASDTRRFRSPNNILDFRKDFISNEDSDRMSSVFSPQPIENQTFNQFETRFFDQFIYRGLQTQVNFEPGKTYELEIKNDQIYNTLPVGSYNERRKNKFIPEKTVPGFTITLKELPPNTKFAFDGKDDIGKTYEQVKKEFILYDKDAEKTKE